MCYNSDNFEIYKRIIKEDTIRVLHINDDEIILTEYLPSVDGELHDELIIKEICFDLNDDDIDFFIKLAYKRGIL